MDRTPELSLPYLMAAQSQKHVTYNEAMRALDALVQLAVLDKDLAAPPGSPANGDRYIVATGASGLWSGQAGKIAQHQDGAWQFYAPAEGFLAWVADENKIYSHNGSSWAPLVAGLGHLVDDTAPQLGGTLDANGRNIAFDTGTGITDDAGNEQAIFHKTTAAVNQLGITNAASGNPPQIAAEGSDANIDLRLRGKGTGSIDTERLGISAGADATNRLALSSPASLFNHAGNGHQVKLNKNAAGDTASFLFQTNWSGRAEIGTTGDDDFHFKVSDGSSWFEAFLIDRASGDVKAPNTLTVESGTAIPAGGTTGTGLRLSSHTNFGIFFGSGAPTLSAAQGSLYLRSDGSSTSTRLYVNTNGGTAWTSVTTAS